MTSLIGRINPAAYPFILLLAFWLVGSFLSSVAGGWFSLSFRFSSHTKPQGEVHSVQPFLNPVYFRYWIQVGGVRLIASKDALFLSVLFPFRFGYPPLCIPWSEIQFSTSRKNWLAQRPFIFRDYVVLTLGNEERIPLRVSSRVALKLGILDRIPGGDSMEVEPNFDELPESFSDPTIKKSN